MARVPAELARYLDRLAARSAADAVSDAESLDRYAGGRDELAFTNLVARHGKMVQGVCHRVLGDVQAAEDAFQAAFMVLARKAHRLRRSEFLAGWLHGVALRIARKARVRKNRQPMLQPLDAVPERPDHRPEPLDEMTARDLLALIDAEVQQLPEVYRLPVVLCCLEGLSQPEAARRLGWTSGSVKGRLERGRERLRRGLSRRGVNLPAMLLPTILGTGGGLNLLPFSVANVTARAATAFATSQCGLATSAASPALLARGEVVGMCLAKLSLLAFFLGGGLLIAGFGLLAHPGPDADKPAPDSHHAQTGHAPQAIRLDAFGGMPRCRHG